MMKATNAHVLALMEKCLTMVQGACDDDIPSDTTNEDTCFWNGSGSGYLCEWDDMLVSSAKSSLSLVSDGKPTTLIPRDNYVGDMQENANHELDEGERERCQ